MHHCGMRYILFQLQLIWSRRLYLAEDMTNLNTFIQGLESSFSELFFSESIHIACNIFSCKILIILYKMLIIIEIFNETKNELYAILYQNVAIFDWQELVSLFQVQEKLKTCRNSKWSISSRIIIWLTNSK